MTNITRLSPIHHKDDQVRAEALLPLDIQLHDVKDQLRDADTKTMVAYALLCATLCAEVFIEDGSTKENFLVVMDDIFDRAKSGLIQMGKLQ